MIRSGMIAVRLLRKTTERPSNPLHSITARRQFTSKETAKRLTKDATRIAQDAGRIAQDSSKVLVRVFEELWSSNEVKLVRLSAVRAYELGQKLFDKHVLKNPNLKSLLVSIKAKLDQISTTVAEANQEATKKAKKTDLSVPKKDERKQLEGETEGKGEKETGRKA